MPIRTEINNKMKLTHGKRNKQRGIKKVKWFGIRIIIIKLLSYV